MDDHWLPARPVLRPGLRVARRDDHHLQVGLGPEQRVLLPDEPAVHDLLSDLRVGRRPAVDAPDVRRWCHALVARGLLVDAEEIARSLSGPVPRPAVLASFAQAGPDATVRLEARRHARVAIVGDEPWRAMARRMLASVGVTGAGDPPTATLVVNAGGEPQRADVDPFMRAGSGHLLVTNVGARVTVGPFVTPGLTACLRCVDAHRSDADPRHAMIVEQHPPEPDEPCDPLLMQLALAWAVRDLVTYVEGGLPATWSATVTLGPDLTVERREWTRHPRCGCSWGDALVG